MYLCVFEDDRVDHLLPLVHTRAVYDLRLGARTLLKTISNAFDASGLLLHARKHVAPVTGRHHDAVMNRLPEGLDVLFVNGRYVAEEGDVLDRLRAAARPGEPPRAFIQEGVLVAAWLPKAMIGRLEAEAITADIFSDLPTETIEGALLIGRLWHLLDELPDALHRDYHRRTHGYNVLDHGGADIHERATLVAPEQIFIAPSARVYPGAVLNAEEGPILIDDQAVVREQAVVRGPAYIGPNTLVKVAAHLSESAIGPWCKVAGEVECSIIHSYSNKAHPGFLGHSYVGSWCNFGADTNTSNLKNDYGEVRLYDAAESDFVGTGRQFCGLVMGDHSKCSINSMFNTGTVVGVFCNIFGAGFPPRHLPSFAWGDASSGFTTYRLDKALEVAGTVMSRREVTLTDADRAMLEAVFEATEAERTATL